MNRTSTLSLLLGLTGVALAGCSSPGDGGGIPPAPSGTPEFVNNPTGQAGTNQTAMEPLNPAGGAGGQAGTTNDVAPGAMAGSAGMGGSAMGAAGTTGMTGTDIPIGTGTVIAPGADGWVPGSSNQFGIQGSFYPIADTDNGGGGTTTIQPLDFADGRACITGDASVVVDGEFTTYWGGGLAFNLADPGNMTGPAPWDRGSVVGFSFDVTGPGVPPAGQFRFGAAPIVNGAPAQEYCVGIQAGANTVLFSSIVFQCWPGGMGTPDMADATEIQAIQWEVATVEADRTPFDFCIENLTPIVQ